MVHWHMRLSSEYYSREEEEWSIRVLRGKWQADLWPSLLALIEKQPFSKHPQTLQLEAPFAADADVFFLKIFHGFSGVSMFKDIFRDSKAFRSLRQAAALARFDFNVPIAVAAGEQRKHRLLRKAFILTLGLQGQPLPAFLRQHGMNGQGMSWLEKRRGLKQLALEIRRLHRLGFVHGDLVPTNVFVSRSAAGRNRLFLMDNDRTRRYPRWFPQTFWRRNLVQLNRIPLPGITLQDRVRFFKYYFGLTEWGSKERRLLCWLERKTRQRRRECDSVDVKGSFRQLMQWHAH
jgi:Lipopolysaccharide kinase (Kdo/WaaP) family